VAGKPRLDQPLGLSLPSPRCARRLSPDECAGTTCAARPHRPVAFLPPIFDRKIFDRKIPDLSGSKFSCPPFSCRSLRHAAPAGFRQMDASSTFWTWGRTRRGTGSFFKNACSLTPRQPEVSVCPPCLPAIFDPKKRRAKPQFPPEIPLSVAAVPRPKSQRLSGPAVISKSTHLRLAHPTPPCPYPPPPPIQVPPPR
jgi:hypothetical protein